MASELAGRVGYGISEHSRELARIGINLLRLGGLNVPVPVADNGLVDAFAPPELCAKDPIPFTNWVSWPHSAANDLGCCVLTRVKQAQDPQHIALHKQQKRLFRVALWQGHVDFPHALLANPAPRRTSLALTSELTRRMTARWSFSGSERTA